MRKIVLCCASGMSTSLVVQKMKKIAAEQGYECSIVAVPYSASNKTIAEADVILLGPQVRFNLKPCQERFPNIPCGVIDMKDYGVCDGKAILQQAKNLLGD